MKMRKPFRLNRSEAKMMGVCAGIADHFAIDVTLVRVGMALAMLTTFPIVLIGYFVLAGIASNGSEKPRTPIEAPRGSPARMDATRERMRDLDRRMQAIEVEIVDGNPALAREIDALR